MIQAIVKWHPSIGDEEIGGEGICFTYDEKNNCFQMKGEISRYRQCPEHPSRFEVKLLDSEHELCEVGHLNGVFDPENRHHDY